MTDPRQININIIQEHSVKPFGLKLRTALSHPALDLADVHTSDFISYDKGWENVLKLRLLGAVDKYIDEVYKHTKLWGGTCMEDNSCVNPPLNAH